MGCLTLEKRGKGVERKFFCAFYIKQLLAAAELLRGHRRWCRWFVANKIDDVLPQRLIDVLIAVNTATSRLGFKPSDDVSIHFKRYTFLRDGGIHCQSMTRFTCWRIYWNRRDVNSFRSLP